MIDNEFILHDRLQKIRQIINQYGEDNFYISYSGGKDSTVLHHLIDMAIPDNKIPRIYCDTGIELNMIRDFVSKQCKLDDRFIMIKPSKNVRKILEEYGYPFKSKQHSSWLDKYQRIGRSKGVVQYLGERTDREKWSSEFSCPAKLKYQFSPDFNIRVSDKCCVHLKEKPMIEWSKSNNKPYNINGIMPSDGGRRNNTKCLLFRNDKLTAFHPLAPLTKEWENWFIKKYNIALCILYYPPYNFNRTGCKGCPFAKYLQIELNQLEHFFPSERKQCEIIWKPIYDEYRRIGYRLKGGEE